VAYAIQAEAAKTADNANTLNGFTAGDFLSAVNPNDITGISGGPILSIANTGNGDGLYSFATGDSTNGVYGYAAGTNGHGMLGYAAGPSGHGVHGFATGSNSIGVYGEGPVGVKGESSDGNGIIGKSIGPDGSGVFGNNTEGVGVKGQSDLNDGVVGWTGAGDRSGVYGHSTVGRGVSGRSDQHHGVFGATFSTNPVHAGVYGQNNGTGIGLWGQTASTGEWTPAIYGKNEGNGDGIYGWSQNRHGIFGVANGGVEDAGVYGTNNGAGPAIKADGKLEVTGETVVQGDLKVAGAFKGDLGNGGAPFPRPVFVSEWLEFFNGGSATLGVSLYLPAAQYSRDNFVVELQCKCLGSALDSDYCNCPGGKWGDLKFVEYHIREDNDVTVVVGFDISRIKVRTRVWYYQ